jgi:hypothetical protein
MGAAETEHLMIKLASVEHVLAISFRRTFASDFASKMGLVDYQDVNRTIDMTNNKYKRVIVQTPSFFVLVLDEIESIFT